MIRNARAAVVAAGHELVVESAAEVLRAGGNAYDAVVSAGFASAIVEPALTSLGGGGFLLAVPAAGPARLFDFFVDTPGRGLDLTAIKPAFVPVVVRFPGADQVFHIGPGSVAVPGNLKGFAHAHAALGRMSLRDVIAPAARLARDGAVVTEMQRDVLALLAPILTHSPECAALFAGAGALPSAGERLAFPEVADFLESLAEGGLDAFYRGEIAARIDHDMREEGGLLTRADLAAYEVKERAPLEHNFRGRRILMNPPPSGGGVRVARYLALLEERLVDATGLSPGDAAYALALAEAIREGELRPSQTTAVRGFSRGTTHVSVIDADGNAASMTTSNGEGSAYVAPGTGVVLNNMLGEDDLHPEGFHMGAPGERVSSMMCPTVVVEDGRASLVLGSGGSKRIRTAVLQVLSHVLDLGLPVDEAVRAPRLHWDGELLQVEPGFSEEALAALEERFCVDRWTTRSLYFGGVHAVVAGKAGEAGAGDPRRGGAAARVPSRPS